MLEPERKFGKTISLPLRIYNSPLAGQACDDLIILESYRVTSDFVSVYCKLQAFTGSLFYKVVTSEMNQTLS